MFVLRKLDIKNNSPDQWPRHPVEERCFRIEEEKEKKEEDVDMEKNEEMELVWENIDEEKVNEDSELESRKNIFGICNMIGTSDSVLERWHVLSGTNDAVNVTPCVKIPNMTETVILPKILITDSGYSYWAMI